MTGTSAAFYGLALLLVGSSVMAVSARNIFHAALYLILALFSVAGLYVVLHAEFLAAVQVLIYVGAVAVLIIFAVMLTSRIPDLRVRAQNEQVTIGLIVSVVLFAAVCFAAWSTWWPLSDLPMATDNVRAVGKLLMTRYVLPFEIVSVLLLAAMVGAIVIAAKERRRGEAPGE